ncbi:MAG: right-handed parallel beta-helix repeat-containing protein [Clostridia bacterium]|nr:right-handed parallel beta-helix repeat-containing protein [Clostridia bacterium]
MITEKFCRRMAALVSAGVILFSFAACEGTASPDTDSETAAVTAAGTEAPTAQSPAPLTLYVAVNGSDENDGSADAPFATLDGVRRAIRKLDKTNCTSVTVEVSAGEYRIKALDFGIKDSGSENCPIIYRAKGDGEVVLNGGISLAPELFSPVTDAEMLARLSPEAQTAVRCVDLKALGVTPEQYGKLYALGSYNTASRYEGDYTGDLYCELFVNDQRMTVARYPNDGYLKTGAVISEGAGLESLKNPHVANPDFYAVMNPAGDVYRVSDELADRVASWKTLHDVWMFGFWAYDWADASTPIGSFDASAKEVSTKFVSMFGAKADAPYYFYNVFEELDTPGEWYLDWENGVLYLYPDGELSDSVIDLSLSTETLITAENANHLTFDGFTMKGTRGDAMSLTGNHNTVKNCLIKNIAGNAITVVGTDNRITANEITRTGRGGILITGGDRETLTAGNNLADNNLIHDWSEIYQTYQAAVALNGVGNTCSHNEIFNSPHEAITYSGNNHVIEYNVIHDVCLLSSDAGAIYAGRRWDYYGTVIRYNYIHDLGSGDYIPSGIYWDDALSGQTAYGNLLVNIPGFAFHLGGGRDLDVQNNIIVSMKNVMTTPINYDARAIEGLTGGWFTAAAQGGVLWTELEKSPWRTALWQETYPQYQHYSVDFGNTDSPDFPANPANSIVRGNLVVAKSDKNKPLGSISDKAYTYSDISDNAVYFNKDNILGEIFVSAETGDFHFIENPVCSELLPEFKALPVDAMGREN